MAAIVLSLAACTGTEPSADEPAAPAVAVYLNIGVSLRDVDAPSRAATAPGNDDPNLRNPLEGEKMSTLRLIIMRPDGTVEANRHVADLTDAQMLEYTFSRIRVNPKEKKTVFLIANEEALDSKGRRLLGDIDLAAYNEGYWVDTETNTRIDFTAETPAPRRVHYVSGDLLPVVTLEALATPALDIAGGDRLSTAAPGLLITARETVDVAEQDLEKTFDLHRAATKFTLNFINNSDYDIAISNLAVSGIASRQFVFPRFSTIINDWDSTTGDKIEQITDFTVPDASYAGMAHLTAPLSAGFDLPQKETHKLSGLYFPESKAEKNILSFTVNGAEFEAELPHTLATPGNLGLPYGLPRNTHVVVNVTFNLKKVDLVLDVIPFTLIDLSPEYGLKRDEATGWLIWDKPPCVGYLVDPYNHKLLNPEDNKLYNTDGTLYDPDKDPSIEAE